MSIYLCQIKYKQSYLLQLHVGFFEVTDLVMNTVGGFAGGLMSVGVRKVVGERALN